MKPIQTEFDFGQPRQIGDLVIVDEEPVDKIFEIINVIPEDTHYLPYGVVITNPEMYTCRGLGYDVYEEDLLYVGRYV